MNPNNETSIDVYSLVTNRIIELLEQGDIPWRQSWINRGQPRNLISKRPYRGVNTLLLNSLEYTSNLFLTWKQVKTINASVLKGEKGHIVVFTKMVEKQDEPSKKHFMLRYYKVFNSEQCKDIPPAFIPQENSEHEPLPSCDAVIESMEHKPPIVFKSNEAYYQPKGDYINMPKKKSFTTSEAYYSVLFHELIHSTGHESRLNRKEITDKIVFGSENYSLEELTAEIGACFLNSHTGIFHSELTNNVAYIQHWLTVLRNDKRFIVKASARAQQAVEYLLGKKEETIPEEQHIAETTY